MTRNIKIIIYLLNCILMAQPTGREIIEEMDQVKKPMDIQTHLKMTLISLKGGKERRRSRELTSFEKRYEDGQYDKKSLLIFSFGTKKKDGVSWGRILVMRIYQAGI